VPGLSRPPAPGGTGPSGSKRIGHLWRADPGEGAPPAAAPAVRGFVRSPFEPRVAVLVTLELLGIEGIKQTSVWFFGAWLDRGWTSPGAP